MDLNASDTTKLAALATQLNVRHPAVNIVPSLILFSDEVRLPNPLRAAQRLSRGSALILRHYQSSDRSALAHSLAKLCRARGLDFLVAGDPGLAASVQADGLHFGEGRIHEVRRWRQRRPNWFITVSVHSTSAIIKACHSGADAAILSPVFATQSHPDARPLGSAQFASLIRKSCLPVIALGGINSSTARRLKNSGAAGLAAIGAFKVEQDISPD